MTTTTANGLPATAVRGIPNTWIVRSSDWSYDAVTTYGIPIEEIDTSDIRWDDSTWDYSGHISRTLVSEYASVEEGRELAGWYVQIGSNFAEPHHRAADALTDLKQQLRERHAEQQARIPAPAVTKAVTANDYKAERLTGNYWLIRTDTNRFDLVKVDDGHAITDVTFSLWRGHSSGCTPVANANRFYDRKIGKMSWHIADEGKYEDCSTPYVKDLKDVLTIRAENHAALSAAQVA